MTFLSACQRNNLHEKAESEIELELMKKASNNLENKNYDQAYVIYSQFVINYPTHPYVDDAAYRLAYLSVIADKENPFFNYKNGLSLFQNFIENYPNSRYINACQNWVNLLNTIIELSKNQSVSAVGKGINSSEINRLKNELKRLRAENAELKNTLDELQEAIER
jgi:outer membrane protein assembly factor BamD (BamD/ComL family)